MNHPSPILELIQLGMYTDAIAIIHRDCPNIKTNGTMLKLLGVCQFRLGQGGIDALQKAAVLLPADDQVLSYLGAAFKSQDRLEEAKNTLLQCLDLNPENADAYFNLGNTLSAMGLTLAAVMSLKNATSIRPDFVEAHNNLGIQLKNSQQLLAAIESYRTAISLDSQYWRAHFNLGNAFQEMDRNYEAISAYYKALHLDPRREEVNFNLGNSLQKIGQIEEAAMYYRKALEVRHNFFDARSHLLFCLTHGQEIDPQDLLAEHVLFGKLAEQSNPPNIQVFDNNARPDKVIRVGFVSADFRKHPVMHMFKPVLSVLSKQTDIRLYAYFNSKAHDTLSDEAMGSFCQWIDISELNDENFSRVIRSDQIDILFDLSGHTDGNRLLAFARRLAPVQISWIGYPGSTGLQAMDYFVADHFFLDNKMIKNQFTEKIIYLPAAIPFIPSDALPDINALPALSSGHITFGSFNRMNKLNPATVMLWCALMRQLPHSTMLMVGISAEMHSTIRQWFATGYISQNRVEILPRCRIEDYLLLYHRVDMCLDAFPYNAASTSGHGLWMGVPTLTIAGNTAASSAGAAFLRHAGLSQFIAHDSTAFVPLGVGLARDIGGLSAIRQELRRVMSGCILNKPDAIARHLMAAMREAWARWCAGETPADIETIDALVGTNQIGGYLANFGDST